MKTDKNSIGTRMKSYYESRTRILLPRRSNIIIRIDGKAFHTYTRGLNRPIDDGLTEDMNLTAKYLCENIQGAKFGFVQSDEISIWITDYDDIQTDGWFDNSVQKMCSISSSLATAQFNHLRMLRSMKEREEKTFEVNSKFYEKFKLAMFDSRVFVIPEMEEVINYFVWRQQDATRNSISMAAQSMFSHKELQGKSSNEMQELMFTLRGVNWSNYPEGFKRGRAILRNEVISELSSKIELVKEQKNALVKKQLWEEAAKFRQIEKDLLEKLNNEPKSQVVRKRWEVVNAPIFTQNRDFIGAIMINVTKV